VCDSKGDGADMNHTLLKARVAVKNACEDASKPMEKNRFGENEHL